MFIDVLNLKLLRLNFYAISKNIVLDGHFIGRIKRGIYITRKSSNLLELGMHLTARVRTVVSTNLIDVAVSVELSRIPQFYSTLRDYPVLLYSERVRSCWRFLQEG